MNPKTNTKNQTKAVKPSKQLAVKTDVKAGGAFEFINPVKWVDAGKQIYSQLNSA